MGIKDVGDSVLKGKARKSKAKAEGITEREHVPKIGHRKNSLMDHIESKEASTETRGQNYGGPQQVNQ